MAHPFLKEILDALWPRGQAAYYKVWTVLDGARDQRIYAAVDSTYLVKRCLYSGNLAPETKLTAPYLIELERDDRFTRYIINQGWGNSWGIYFRSTEGMERIRSHLRGLLVVKDERGRRLVFRYYDPRVLRVYLPTCVTREYQMVFGPIDRFLVEGEDPATLIRFEFDRTSLSLSQETVELQTASVS